MEGGWENPWWSDIRRLERRKQCLVLKVRYYIKHLKRRRGDEVTRNQNQNV